VIARLPAANAPPTFTPAAGTYDQGVDVTISATSSPATICYTTDGSNPGCQYALEALCDEGARMECTGDTTMTYGGSPIRIEPPAGGGSVVVKAVACSTDLDTSEIASATIRSRLSSSSRAEASRVQRRRGEASA